MGKISQEIFLRKSFDNAIRLKENPDWEGEDILSVPRFSESSW